MAGQLSSISHSQHIMTQQEKLDALLGITGGQDLDTYLDGLSLDEAVQKNDEALSGIEQLSSLDQDMKAKMEELQGMPSSLTNVAPNELSIQMMSMDHSLKELEEMVDLSKDVIRHVQQSILATPLIDSEAVQAYSKLVESIHISISEFIGVYRDKQNLVNKIRYALFDKEIKKELMDHKAKLQKELMLLKDGPKSIDADHVETNSRAWNVDQVTKILDNRDKEQQDNQQ